MGRQDRNIQRYETQILQNGKKYDNGYDECKNKDNHWKYIEVRELPNHLPDSSLLEFINISCDLTVMIEVKCDVGEGSPKDTELRCGSGFVQKIEIVSNKPCPCRSCKPPEAVCKDDRDTQLDSNYNKVAQSNYQGNNVTEWAKVTISTALHVIHNENDAQICRARLFYETPDSKEEYLHGFTSHSRDLEGDWCALVCITHDTNLSERLSGKLRQHWQLGRSLKEIYNDQHLNQVIVVAHPHGGPKKVSIGEGKIKDLAREVRVDQDWCYYSYDATTCDGSSGGPVYILKTWNDGFGYWFGHAHNHCGIDSRNCSSSTIGVDSTYGQLVRPFSTVNMDTNSAEILNTDKSPHQNIHNLDCECPSNTLDL